MGSARVDDMVREMTAFDAVARPQLAQVDDLLTEILARAG
jgi:hypothetical protein